MAVQFPELDNQYSGGSDIWDDGVAGEILLRDYFDAPAPPSGGGQLKVWNGSAFVAKPVKVWNGSSWVTKPVKHWTGSAWVETTY